MSTSNSKYPYTLVPTHDMHLMSLSELPWRARTFWGVIYRCLALNSWKMVRGRLGVSSLLAGFRLAASLPLIKAGIARDPVETATYSMIEFERRLGIRSTLYVMPFSNRPGRTPEGTAAPANRACFYDPATYAQWFRELAREGWEIGVHGIDSHLDARAVRDERQALEKVTDREVVGVRMHWLYHCGALTYRLLGEAGYLYDATLGWNHAVGWPEDRYAPYQTNQGIWVLPLNIQDGALLRDAGIGPRPGEALRQVEAILAEARAHRAVVTILWHNNSFGPPLCWTELYQWIIRRAQADKARIMTAREVVEDHKALADRAWE